MNTPHAERLPDGTIRAIRREYGAPAWFWSVWSAVWAVISLLRHDPFWFGASVFLTIVFASSAWADEKAYRKCCALIEAMQNGRR
jgi:hypothetical protein